MAKPAFDPNQSYQAVSDNADTNANTSKPAFDPNKPYSAAADTESTPVSKSSYSGVPDDQLNMIQKAERSGVEHGLIQPGYEMFSPASLEQKKLALKTAVNTATMGYEPQIEGLLKTGSVSSPEYIQARDKAISDLANTTGGTKAAGEAIGMLPTMAIGAPNLAKTATGRIAQGVGIGGAMGLLSNPGDTQGKLNPIQAEDRFKNAGIGAATGGAMSGLAEAMPAIAEAAGKKANLSALKQGGAMLGDLRSLDYKGRIDSAGQLMLDEGIITPFASLDHISDRTQAALDKYGSQLGQIRDNLDKNFESIKNNPELSQKLVTGNSLANSLQEKLLDPMLKDETLKKFAGPVQEYIDDYKKLGDTPIPFGELNKKIGNIDKVNKYESFGGFSNDVRKQVRGIVNNEMDNSIKAIGNSTNFPMYDIYKDASNKYGTLKDIKEIADDKMFRLNANRAIAPSDYATALATMVAEKSAGGGLTPQQMAASLGAGAANKFGRKYGNAVIATGANQLAKKAPEIQQGLKAGLLPALTAEQMRNQP